MLEKELEQFVKSQNLHWEFSENNTKLELHLNWENMEKLVGEEFIISVDITELCKYHDISLEELNFNRK